MDDGAFAALWVGGFVAAAIVLSVINAVAGKARRARRAARRQWAETHGWQSGASHAGRVTGGGELLARRVGDVEVTSYVATYSADWRRGMDSTRYRHTLVATIDASCFPLLTIDPRAGLHKPPEAVNPGSVVILESADFNDAWLVRSSDPQFAHAFCHPRLMARLLEPDAADLSVLVHAESVAVHALGRTDLESIEARAAVLVDIVRLLPAHLREQYASRWAQQGRRRLWRSPHLELRGGKAPATGWATIALATLALTSAGGLLVEIARDGGLWFSLGSVAVIAGVVLLALLLRSGGRQ
jgi:hypothetical protein